MSIFTVLYLAQTMTPLAAFFWVGPTSCHTTAGCQDSRCHDHHLHSHHSRSHHQQHHRYHHSYQGPGSRTHHYHQQHFFHQFIFQCVIVVLDKSVSFLQYGTVVCGGYSVCLCVCAQTICVRFWVTQHVLGSSLWNKSPGCNIVTWGWAMFFSFCLWKVNQKFQLKSKVNTCHIFACVWNICSSLRYEL